MLKNSCLFEISWEVCNKVGGIHTVLQSKISSLLAAKSKNAEYLLGNYYVVGPYLNDKTHEFTTLDMPENFREAYEKLKKKGIIIHYGEWNISTKPKAILVEYLGFSEHTNDIKSKLWEQFSIDSLNSNWHDFDEVMLWAWCCGVAIEELRNSLCSKVIVHAHEWISGASILYLKSINSSCKSVFTTHATMMGRALAGSGFNLYEMLNQDIDWDKKAYELGIPTKHQMEKVLARKSDCFTTVSDITNKEASIFYGKAADVLLYNGFNNHLVKPEEIDKSRQENLKFLKGYFHDFGGIKDDINIFFTSGRYEIRNKGIDVLVKALSELNTKLKNENSPKQVVALFLVILGKFEKDSLVLESIENYNNQKSIGYKDFAPLSTHTLPIDNNLIQLFMQNNLLNRKDDNVKVIFIPSILNGGDDYLHRQYYDVTKGLDLGIFPSFYEPWGYTPLEALSFGVPALTTNLAGFGRYVHENNLENSALSIISRDKKEDEEVIEDINSAMYWTIHKSDEEVSQSKIKARELALKCDWSAFYQHYIDAYKFASKEN